MTTQLALFVGLCIGIPIGGSLNIWANKLLKLNSVKAELAALKGN